LPKNFDVTKNLIKRVPRLLHDPFHRFFKVWNFPCKTRFN